LLHENMSCMLGDYFYKAPAYLLTGNGSSGVNEELNQMNKKRMVVISEPDENKALNVSFIKEATGGGTLNARGIYSKDTEVKLVGTVICELNEMLMVNGNTDSDALVKRFRDVKFKSRFVEDEHDVDEEVHIYQMNSDYKNHDFKKKHACALFKYIVTTGQMKMRIPESVKLATKEYLLNSDIIYSFINERLVEATGDEYDDWRVIELSDLYNDFKDSSIFKGFTKNETRKYKKSYFIDKIQSHSVLSKFFSKRFSSSKENIKHFIPKVDVYDKPIPNEYTKGEYQNVLIKHRLISK